jgi:hypothetical protein
MPIPISDAQEAENVEVATVEDGDDE